MPVTVNSGKADRCQSANGGFSSLSALLFLSFKPLQLSFNAVVDEGTQGDVRDGADAVFGSRRDEDVDALVMGLIVIVAVFALT